MNMDTAKITGRVVVDDTITARWREWGAAEGEREFYQCQAILWALHGLNGQNQFKKELEGNNLKIHKTRRNLWPESKRGGTYDDAHRAGGPKWRLRTLVFWSLSFEKGAICSPLVPRNLRRGATPLATCKVKGLVGIYRCAGVVVIPVTMHRKCSRRSRFINLFRLWR